MRTTSYFGELIETGNTVDKDKLKNIIIKLINRKKDWLFDQDDTSHVLGEDANAGSHMTCLLISTILFNNTNKVINSRGPRPILSSIGCNDYGTEIATKALEDVLTEHPLFYRIRNNSIQEDLMYSKYSIEELKKFIDKHFEIKRDLIKRLVPELLKTLLNPDYYTYSINDGRVTGWYLKHNLVDLALVELFVRYSEENPVTLK